MKSYRRICKAGYNRGSYNQQHLDYFIDIVDKLVKLDTLLNKENGLDRRLFGDQNARIGFIVSMATHIFGRPSKNMMQKEFLRSLTI